MKKKPTWFFLRGLVRGQDHWDDFLEVFQLRFPNAKIVPIDIPGNGRSFQKKSPLTVKKMMEEIRDQALPHLGDSNFLFTISLGSMIAMEWLRSHPKEIQGAVFINSSSRNSGKFYERLRPMNYGNILKLLAYKDLEERELKILSMTSSNTKKHKRISKAWAELQRKYPVSAANAARQVLAASRFHSPESAPPGKFLFLASQGDQFVHWQCTEKIAKQWKQPFAVHPTGGHDLPLDEGIWVLDQVEKFLS